MSELAVTLTVEQLRALVRDAVRDEIARLRRRVADLEADAAVLAVMVRGGVR